MAGRVRILVSRHAAFYTPLIVTIAGGFLREEGLASTYAVKPVDRGTFDILAAGEVDVVQAAVSSNWARMEKGVPDLPAHFAQINRRDGFWIAAREAGSFDWKDLEGKNLLADHGPQPMAMLRYAGSGQGVDWDKVTLVDAGGPGDIDAAFRAGQGDFVHQQGPAPQQLEDDGVGYVVASVGQAMPPVAFSSLMASHDFLKTAIAKAFMRAYRRALAWLQKATASTIAAREAAYFPDVPAPVLTRAIAAYKEIGCWSEDPAIPEPEYNRSLDVFLAAGAITKRHAFGEVVVPPPG
jgi:NitT/TauT family transport system substrate-binding protein